MTQAASGFIMIWRRRGTAWMYPAPARLQVFLGNAPGVSIELNGAPFDQTPFVQPDNTARFHLGETDGNGGQTG